MKKSIYSLCLLIFIVSRKLGLQDDGVFPKVQNITELKNTDFVPTMESSFDLKTNNVYGATIPFAWNEIRNEIGATLTDFTNEQLEEINNTKSYINVLKEDEYETSVEVGGQEIMARAYFRKSLPFEEALTKSYTPLNFGKQKVESFGFWGNCEFAKINYFNDETDFSISIFPKDKAHEIILINYQGVKPSTYSFGDYFKRYQQKKLGNQNTYFNDEDKVEIPIIEFNLEKVFKEMLESTFKADDLEFNLAMMYQRNAFILNENGAEVESEVEVATDSMGEYEEPQPKMMIFDKPFVVFLKRRDADNPYFGVYIADGELLKSAL